MYDKILVIGARLHGGEAAVAAAPGGWSPDSRTPNPTPPCTHVHACSRMKRCYISPQGRHVSPNNKQQERELRALAQLHRCTAHVSAAHQSQPTPYPAPTCSRRVSFESRKGTCGLPEARALMHMPSIVSDRLIARASVALSPVERLFLRRSLPARSTRYSLPTLTWVVNEGLGVQGAAGVRPAGRLVFPAWSHRMSGSGPLLHAVRCPPVCGARNSAHADT